MVGQMTYGKRQWEEHDDQMRELIPIVNEASVEMVKMVDADTNAFNDYMVRSLFQDQPQGLLVYMGDQDVRKL